MPTKKFKNKAYVSEIDLALAQFNQQQAPSAAQQAEAEKYKRIYQFRDHATPLEKNRDIWDFDQDSSE